MLAALVIDGLDQTIFQTFTSIDLSNYQQYDKALDVYYLSIAYVATLRNWTNFEAFGISRFLYYYRLGGVVAFELTQVRALLLIFPNTFEYFFDTYEAVRVRWDPRRMSRRLLLAIAAFIWIVIKLPQEWWIHVAQLGATDLLKTQVFGVSKSASWLDAFAARPLVLVVAGAAIVVLALLAWWVVTRRLPRADRPPTFAADANQPPVDERRIEAVRKRRAENVVDRELFEKIVLVGLVCVIFGRMLPGTDPNPVGVAIGVAIVVLINTAISDWLVRRARRLGFHTTTRQFLGTLAVNVGIVAIGQLVLDVLHGPTLEHAAVFVLLLSVIVTFYDRYRPIHIARFGTGANPPD